MATTSSVRGREAGHWGSVARSWAQVGPPLRPSEEDVRVVRDAAEALVTGRGHLQVLVLGVTPELHQLGWPEGTTVVAVDHTVDMISEVWPGGAHPAVLGSWTELPLASGSCTMVLCDGGLHLLDHPGSQRRFADELARVTGEGGLCLVRLFVPPTRREALEVVLADLEQRRVRDLNILKFRLWMALRDGPSGDVHLDRVWGVLDEVAPDLEALAARIGWDHEHLRAITSYRGSPDRYRFIDLDEAADLFVQAGFEVADVHTPGYELGASCPTIVLRRTTRSARS
jgi:SAM-dependent methyltransferase